MKDKNREAGSKFFNEVKYIIVALRGPIRKLYSKSHILEKEMETLKINQEFLHSKPVKK